ncbi:ORF6N domain-containing protein [Acidovorax sp. A1169]|uniref:ORF6N domain-containing protein n=1 Tax=Acidovorax sp. A1169 TaxID=3059524 RepID=UPI002737B1F0|nr:ORF6N domain-containing protein [Acidovorax sp. A1169]MDP4076249.1 ORF6N domain-containing protein [Acidovorax sp. A1169]
MTEVVTIGAVATPVINFKDQRVCTSKQLAQLYGCSEKNIGDNFENNRERFEEGKHFVKLQGGDLRDFKNQPDIVGLVAKKSAHLILWTERGAMRHAKMLETDVAWEVFEQMEDSYFSKTRARQPITDGQERSTKFDRLPLYHFTVDTVIKHGLLFGKVYALLNLFAGSHSFKEMSKEQSAEVHDFCDRFALGQDTRTDWQRITDNQTKLYGTPAQLDMVQKLLLS